MGNMTIPSSPGKLHQSGGPVGAEGTGGLGSFTDITGVRSSTASSVTGGSNTTHGGGGDGPVQQALFEYESSGR